MTMSDIWCRPTATSDSFLARAWLIIKISYRFKDYWWPQSSTESTQAVSDLCEGQVRIRTLMVRIQSSHARPVHRTLHRTSETLYNFAFANAQLQTENPSTINKHLSHKSDNWLSWYTLSLKGKVKIHNSWKSWSISFELRLFPKRYFLKKKKKTYEQDKWLPLVPTVVMDMKQPLLRV